MADPTRPDPSHKKVTWPGSKNFDPDPSLVQRPLQRWETSLIITLVSYILEKFSKCLCIKLGCQNFEQLGHHYFEIKSCAQNKNLLISTNEEIFYLAINKILEFCLLYKSLNWSFWLSKKPLKFLFQSQHVQKWRKKSWMKFQFIFWMLMRHLYKK